MADAELTASQTKELMALETTINDLQQLLIRGQRAGLNVDDLQRRLFDANNKRQGMIREFGAGATTRRQR